MARKVFAKKPKNKKVVQPTQNGWGMKSVLLFVGLILLIGVLLFWMRPKPERFTPQPGLFVIWNPYGNLKVDGNQIVIGNNYEKSLWKISRLETSTIQNSTSPKFYIIQHLDSGTYLTVDATKNKVKMATPSEFQSVTNKKDFYWESNITTTQNRQMLKHYDSGKVLTWSLSLDPNCNTSNENCMWAITESSLLLNQPSLIPTTQSPFRKEVTLSTKPVQLREIPVRIWNKGGHFYITKNPNMIRFTGSLSSNPEQMKVILYEFGPNLFYIKSSNSNRFLIVNDQNLLSNISEEDFKNKQDKSNFLWEIKLNPTTYKTMIQHFKTRKYLTTSVGLRDKCDMSISSCVLAITNYDYDISSDKNRRAVFP